MPLDAQGLWDRGKVLLADEVIALLSREISPLAPVPDPDPRAPATEYVYEDGGGMVGFIASVSRPFCLNCNRLRLTADGKLRYCLFAIEEDDVKTLMRSGAADEEIAALVRRNVAGKWEGHEINSAKFVAPPRPMYSIGGGGHADRIFGGNRTRPLDGGVGCRQLGAGFHPDALHILAGADEETRRGQSDEGHQKGIFDQILTGLIREE